MGSEETKTGMGIRNQFLCCHIIEVLCLQFGSLPSSKAYKFGITDTATLAAEIVFEMLLRRLSRPVIRISYFDYHSNNESNTHL